MSLDSYHGIAVREAAVAVELSVSEWLAAAARRQIEPVRWRNKLCALDATTSQRGQ